MSILSDLSVEVGSVLSCLDLSVISMNEGIKSRVLIGFIGDSKRYCVYDISGDKLRQEHMYTSNYGHNGVASVSRHAAALHKQRSCFHLGLLGVFTAKSWGTTTDLGRDKRTQGPRNLTDTDYVGKNSLRPLHPFEFWFLMTSRTSGLWIRVFSRSFLFSKILFVYNYFHVLHDSSNNCRKSWYRFSRVCSHSMKNVHVKYSYDHRNTFRSLQRHSMCRHLIVQHSYRFFVNQFFYTEDKNSNFCALCVAKLDDWRNDEIELLKRQKNVNIKSVFSYFQGHRSLIWNRDSRILW